MIIFFIQMSANKSSILLFPVVSLILGIFSAKLEISFFIIVASTFIILTFLITRFQILEKFLIIKAALSILLFFVGYFALIQQRQRFSLFDSLTINKKFILIGNVESIQHSLNNKFPYCTIIKIEKIKEDSNKWIKLSNYIQIYSLEEPSIKTDDTILVKNVRLNNINNLDFKNYLMRININNSFFTKKIFFKILNRPNFSVKRNFENIKYKLINRIQSKMKNNAFCLFSSIFLGNKNLVKKDMQPTSYKFANWGISHIIARSGLHLWILILVLQIIFSLFRSFIVRRILMIIIMIMFYIISWPAIPFTRSIITYILFEFCNIFGFTHNTIHLFLLTCIIILTSNPIQIFFLDFQLSFIITYILLWYAQIIHKNKKLLINSPKIS